MKAVSSLYPMLDGSLISKQVEVPSSDVQKRQSPMLNFAPKTPNSVAVALTQYTVATAVALSAAAIPNKIAEVTAAIISLP